MSIRAERRNGVWFSGDEGEVLVPLTCEIKVPAAERGGPRGSDFLTCGKPAEYRAITGAADLSGQNYDERLCCADCKAADELSGRYVVDGVVVEDYGPMYEYEPITEEWITGT